MLMKYLILLFLHAGILLCNVVNSQQFYNTWFYNYDWVWESGTSAGFMNCLTDLGGRKGNGSRFTKDINWQISRPSFSFYVATTYKDVITIRLEFQSGNIGGADSLLKQSNPDPSGRYGRNLHFRSSIREWQLSVETHPLFWKLTNDDVIPSWSPYLQAGIALFSFNPEAKLNDQWHRLQPLSLEGQGFAEYGDRKPYKTSQLAIPLGLGVRYETGPRFNIRLECVYRILFTDYLDDVSTAYIDPSLFAQYLDPSLANIAHHLHYRAVERRPGAAVVIGEQRGNKQNNDAYFSVLLKLGYVFRSKVK
jgi:hypothetical protein